MIASMLRRGLWVAVCVLTSALGGCGKGDSSAGVASGGNAGEKGTPTAAIKAPAADPDDEDDPDDPVDPEPVMVEPKEGTPEWLVRESTKLRLQPSPQTDDVEKLKAHRKERNEKIIQMCQKAIGQVHENPEKELLFTAAVRNMLEARLQLALAGDRDSIDALYEDAAALHKRNPKAAAAAEGAHTLVNLAYSFAKAGNGDDKQWLAEFLRQASNFAEAFPSDERRSVPLLFTAARSCELAGMTREAVDGYALIQQNFPQSQYAPRTTAVLRRLKLPGNPPQFSGPSLEEDPIVLDDLLGKGVLIVFWSIEAKPFLSQLPTILEVTRTHAKRGLEVIGVNLDHDLTIVNQFVVANRIAWPQIFFREPNRQGWNNPIAVYYGIQELPALWLIDQSGNVVSTSVSIDKLDGEVRKLLAAGATGAEAAGGQSAGQGSDSAAERQRKAVRKPSLKLEEE